MSQLKLVLKQPPNVPLEADVICPDKLGGMTLEQIASQTVHYGRRRRRLDDFFEITGAPSDRIIVQGELNKVRRIGEAMSHGRIEIDGDAGMHLGARMSGGRIHVTGNADDWLGAEMVGGIIRVDGDTGGRVGAAYGGSLQGMKGGRIIVGGSAEIEVGMRMRRGTIVIGGRAGEFAGAQMKGGTIILVRGAAARTGALMKRGTIISLEPLERLPTFRFSCDYNPTFVNLYAKEFEDNQLTLPHHPDDGCYARYCGDITAGGKGELLVWQSGTR